jgi:hypothetical protein
MPRWALRAFGALWLLATVSAMAEPWWDHALATQIGFAALVCAVGVLALGAVRSKANRGVAIAAVSLLVSAFAAPASGLPARSPSFTAATLLVGAAGISIVLWLAAGPAHGARWRVRLIPIGIAVGQTIVQLAQLREYGERVPFFLADEYVLTLVVAVITYLPMLAHAICALFLVFPASGSVSDETAHPYRGAKVPPIDDTPLAPLAIGGWALAWIAWVALCHASFARALTPGALLPFVFLAGLVGAALLVRALHFTQAILVRACATALLGGAIWALVDPQALAGPWLRGVNSVAVALHDPWRLVPTAPITLVIALLAALLHALRTNLALSRTLAAVTLVAFVTLPSSLVEVPRDGFVWTVILLQHGALIFCAASFALRVRRRRASETTSQAETTSPLTGLAEQG